MITIKSLRAFVHIMDHGSMTAAANKMFLSQPAVSRLIQQLEDEFGAKLFHRDSKMLTPSREAEAFYPDALRVLTSFDEVPELLTNLKSVKASPFKVICHPRCVHGLVVPALVEMTKQHPDFKFSLDIYMRAELSRRIIRDRFDVGVFTLPLQVDIAEIQRKRSVEFKVVLPPNHPLSKKDVIRVVDLQGYTHISPSQRRGLISRDLLDEALKNSEANLPITHEVSNSSAALSLVKHGVGYTIADPMAFEPYLLEGLVTVPFEPKIEMDYGFCLARGATPHPHTKAFLSTLDSVFDQVLDKWRRVSPS